MIKYIHIIVILFLIEKCYSIGGNNYIENNKNIYNSSNNSFLNDDNKYIYLPPMANIPLKAKFGIQYKDQISRASMFVFNFTELFDKVIYFN